MFDLIIKNALMVDGTGSSPTNKDIGITKDKISSIGNLSNAESKKIIDAKGQIVSPGFIDTHSHADFEILRNPQHEYGISQGVTTEIMSPDGIGLVPLTKRKSKEYNDYYSGILGYPTDDFDGTTFETAKVSYDKKCKINVAMFAGHGPLRIDICGMEDVPLRGDLLTQAKYNLELALDQGASGFATGLDYYPQSFSDTDELIELCKVVAKKDSIYSVHLRSHEKDRAFANGGILEAIEIARKSGVSLHVEHYRTAEETAGEIDKILEPIDKAKNEGLNITMETYSYPVGCTVPIIFFPGSFHIGGTKKIISNLSNQQTRDFWEKELLKDSQRAGIEEIMWTSIGLKEWKDYAGLTVKDAAKKDGLSPIQHILDMMYRTNLNCGFRGVPPSSVSIWRQVEEDIIELMKRPDYMVGSDAVPTGQMIHPRSYGCFTRFLGRLRRRFNVPIELMINRMTKLPAETFGLKNRGILKEGYFADLVIFDPNIINDLATFEDPEILSVGISQVLVNGKISFESGKNNLELNGRFV